MSTKTLILTICFLLSFTVIEVKANYAGLTEQSKVTTSAAKPATEEYTYVRVYENDHWWIYVYMDGSLILVIPDPDE